MDADLGAEDEGLEGEEDFWGDEDQYYDEYEELYGLPAGDLIDEEMERQLAQFGVSINCDFYGLAAYNYFVAEELTEEDLAIFHAFALKTEDHLTNATFEKLPYTFPTANIQTLKVTKVRIEFLAEFKPVTYDCIAAQLHAAAMLDPMQMNRNVPIAMNLALRPTADHERPLHMSPSSPDLSHTLKMKRPSNKCLTAGNTS
jgi:hypothetical protein